MPLVEQLFSLSMIGASFADALRVPLVYVLAAIALSAAGTRAARALTGVPVDPGPRWSVVPVPQPAAARGWQVVAGDAGAPPSRLVPAADPPLLRSDLEPGSPGDPADLRHPADAQAVVALPRRRRPPLISPSLGGGVPTGYVGGWGDYAIAASAGTPGNLRDGVPDGSLNFGFSLGDPVRSIGVDLNWGIGSIKNFNANGSVAVSAGRVLVNRPELQVAVAAGLIDVLVYGNETGKPAVNGYGAVTLSVPLRPSDPTFQQRFQFSAGAGGNSFAAIDANFQTTDAGAFVAAGLELSPSLGLSVGQSSRSTNLNLSYIPFRDLPVFVNLVAADIFNATPFGTIGVLSVGWGDSLQRGFFSDQSQ